MVLLKRIAYGYDDDLFIFTYNGQKYRRKYGSRYDNKQAKNIFIKEIEQSNKR
ncbi:MAG: hypothetical protein ACLUFN_11320 [Eubacterium sp.]